MTITSDVVLSLAARDAAAKKLGCSGDELDIVNVSGGYSLNRRALVGHENKWLFVKEVDKSILTGDGEKELSWLRKDYDLTSILKAQVPELIPEWSSLEANNHVLLMMSYRTDEGWIWSLPADEVIQHDYIQAVINATKKLEAVTINPAVSSHVNLQPFLRDELALDGGFNLITQNPSIREQLDTKYTAMAKIETVDWLRAAYNSILALLHDEDKLSKIIAHASGLMSQPNDRFNHCDVRSDNLTYHPATGEIKFVDWNWASYAPSKFGSTEFLIDMARRGVDVTPWLDELNPELLAATVGFYAGRCLNDPLSPESTLRTMQAESAAVALSLYDAITAHH